MVVPKQFSKYYKNSRFLKRPCVEFEHEIWTNAYSNATSLTEIWLKSSRISKARECRCTASVRRGSATVSKLQHWRWQNPGVVRQRWLDPSSRCIEFQRYIGTGSGGVEGVDAKLVGGHTQTSTNMTSQWPVRRLWPHRLRSSHPWPCTISGIYH